MPTDDLATTLSRAPFWAWWLAPVLVTAVVALVVRLARRERRPRGGADAVDDYERFRTAMSVVRRPGERPGPADSERGEE
ncbi:hypothetical protein [Angustibacter aerolatus]